MLEMDYAGNAEQKITMAKVFVIDVSSVDMGNDADIAKILAIVRR